MIRACLALSLGIQAVLDMRTGYVYIPLLVLQTVVGLVLGGTTEVSGAAVWSRYLPGALLLLASLSGKSVGQGDGWLFLSLGVYMTMEQQLWLLFCAAALAALWTIPGRMAHPGDNPGEIPFVPFVLAAYLGGWCYGWF